MEQSFWKANSFPASWEIPCTLWNLLVHHHMGNSQPLFSALSQIIPACVISHFMETHFSILIPSAPGSSEFSLFNFPHQEPVFMPCSLHMSHMSSLSHSWLFTWIMFGEEYNSDGPYCAFSSSPHPSLAQMSSSAPCFWTP